MAHYNDMREFLEELKKRGDLMVIDKKVSPVHEICAFTRKSSDMGGPALLFTNVEGYDMPVLSGLYGTRERVRLALGLGDDTKSVIKEYVAHENKFIPPVTVGDDEAPVHEVVLTGDAVDLYKLPILTNFEKDLGPYITAGVQMANDPITGVRNSSMHRMLLLDKNHMLDQAHDFFRASGALTAIEYKDVIEAQLRTYLKGGFQLLSLNDFTGQGYAPVGILDPFWNTKGLITCLLYTSPSPRD